MRRWGAFLALAAMLAWLTPAVGAAPSLGSSPGAMSPRATARSYGARLQETALGCYVADAMRAGAGTDIAIECGGHLVSSLPGGSLTMEDVEAVFAGDLEVAAVEISAGQLFDLLEYAVGNAEIDGSERLDPGTGSDVFPQVSGFSFEFDVSQLAGRRVRWVRMDDGTELLREDGRTVTAALPVDMLDGSMGFFMLEELPYRTVGRQSQLLAGHIRSQGTVEIPDTGRIVMVGSAEKTIYESLHLGRLLPYVILIILLFRLPGLVRKWRKAGARSAELR